MRRQNMFNLGLVGATVVSLAIGTSVYLYLRPTVLRIAVTRESDDFAIIEAAAQAFTREKSSLRLKLVQVESFAESAKELEDGHADLAIVRSDVALPQNGQTVLIMRKNVAILIAPEQAHLRKVKDLGGRKIGVLHRPTNGGAANEELLKMVLAQYDIGVPSVKIRHLNMSELRVALARKEVDVVLAVGVQGEGIVADAAAEIARMSRKPPVFIPISEASAIAKRSPDYESIEVVRGIFGGAQPKPAEDFNTLGVSTRLVARSSLSNGSVGDLTKDLLSVRPLIAGHFPLANKIEAPPTDRGSALPVHPGTIAYLDDDEQSFFDKYSDMIYVGAMLLSVLGTGIATLASWLNRRRKETLDDDLLRAVELIGLAREAEDSASLSMLQSEAEELLAKLVGKAVRREESQDLATHRLVALGLVRDELCRAIAARQSVLENQPRPGFAPRLIVEDQKLNP
jgi:TRAP-type uncharacterized transport system substrate-binding protein